MLKKSLELLAVTLPLVAGLPSQAYAEQYTQPQKPLVYAQVSKTSAGDENLEHRLAIYRNLIFGRGVGKKALEMALGFYNDVIRESQNSPHLAEAYYNSGYILCMFDPNDVGECIRRLDEAYKIGNKDRKIQVLHTKFVLARYYKNIPEKDPNLRSPEHYVQEMEKLDPNLAKELKKELKRFRESQKTK